MCFITSLLHMSASFVHTRPLQHDELIGRTAEIEQAASFLAQGRHISIWGPPKTGKTSLVNAALDRLQKLSPNYVCIRVSCFNIRSMETLWAAIANALLLAVTSSNVECERLVTQWLPLSQPQVVVPRPPTRTYTLQFGNALDPNEVLSLPAQVAKHTAHRVVVVLDAAHCLTHCLDQAAQMAQAARIWKRLPNVSFLLCGTGPLNGGTYAAYKQLCSPKMPFHGFTERIPLSPIPEKEFVTFIIRSFTKAGRIIPQELAQALYRKADGHPYYVQYLADLCFARTKGYVNDAMFNDTITEAYDNLQTHFEGLCNDLSTPQIHYLRAMADHVDRFCGQAVLQQYRLNSSANVFRVRDALERKEIIVMERNKPRFIDPLFEAWFTERYCKTYWL